MCWSTFILSISLKKFAGQSFSSSKNSWKLWHVFVVSFASADKDEAPTTSASKQTTKCHIFFQEFLQGFVKFSKLCQWFHVAKCCSELKNEELSLKQLPLKFFGKFSYYVFSIQWKPVFGVSFRPKFWPGRNGNTISVSVLAETRKVFLSFSIILFYPVLS